MDITNNQRHLYNVIDRSYLTGQRPIDAGVRTKNYTDLVNFNSYANFPYERYNQLDVRTHIGTFGKENSQESQLLMPTINCNPRPNESASRFNYAYDMQVDKRMVDVSGILIPNNKLRVIPNRGTQLLHQNRNLPTNPEIEALSKRMLNISTNNGEDNPGVLKFKASRQRLSRDELLNITRKPVTPAVSGVP